MIRLLVILCFPLLSFGQAGDTVFIKNIVGNKKSTKYILPIDSIFTVVDGKPVAFETKTDSFYIYNENEGGVTYLRTTTFFLSRRDMYYTNLGVDSSTFCCFWIKINKKIFPIFYPVGSGSFKGNKIHLKVMNRSVFKNRVSFVISNGGSVYFPQYVKSVKRVGDMVKYKPLK